ncbi:MAG TPA: fumarylacetoacetate hydrolase family protein [Burkholderiaceae bacterium]|jgi:fumarylpyruvate hydrolase|nr:fumarylacetoacetate hydrolase family protein [Burkholderiaceae bacterium]
MAYVFAPPPQAVVPVFNSDDLFPVHRVYCVGRNYEEHAREMGASGREAPFFFSKPADAVVPAPEGKVLTLPFPSATESLHHEIELVVALGGGGRDIAAAEAPALIWGYTVGLDLTRRDLQAEAKKQGRPWDTAKGFDQSAPVGPIRPVGRIGHQNSGEIWLAVNGERRQSGDVAQMIWNVAEIIEHLSRYYELRAGDLIFTGTPAGVGPVQRGDEIEAAAAGAGTLRVRFV